MAFNCIVLAREIWDTRDLIGAVLDDSNNLKESALSTRFEPEDLNALEIALKIKGEHGGSVTVLSLGESKNVDVLRESLFRGVDKVYRLTDPNTASLDTYAVASIFTKAVEKVGDYQLIITGVNLSEGENSLLGVNVARMLGIEQLSYIDNLEEVSAEKVVCKRAIEMGFEVLESAMPAVISVGIALVKDDPRTPRSAKAALKLKQKKTPIESWSSQDLGISDTQSLITTERVKYEAVEQKVVESKKVDSESESELKTMLDEILK